MATPLCEQIRVNHNPGGSPDKKVAPKSAIPGFHVQTNIARAARIRYAMQILEYDFDWHDQAFSIHTDDPWLIVYEQLNFIANELEDAG